MTATRTGWLLQTYRRRAIKLSRMILLAALLGVSIWGTQMARQWHVSPFPVGWTCTTSDAATQFCGVGVRPR